jgi:hypothetical protein
MSPEECAQRLVEFAFGIAARTMPRSSSSSSTSAAYSRIVTQCGVTGLSPKPERNRKTGVITSARHAAVRSRWRRIRWVADVSPAPHWDAGIQVITRLS